MSTERDVDTFFSVEFSQWQGRFEIIADFFEVVSLLVAVTITLLAAMPTGVLASVLAEQYRSASGAASSSIMISSIMGTVTLSFWLIFFAPFLRG